MSWKGSIKAAGISLYNVFTYTPPMYATLQLKSPPWSTNVYLLWCIKLWNAFYVYICVHVSLYIYAAVMKEFCVYWHYVNIFVTNILQCSYGSQLTSDFSIVIQIRWKFHSALIQVVVKWSIWSFAHGTTAALSWHVQDFVTIWYPTINLYWNTNSIEFELRGKMVPEMGPCLYDYWINIGCRKSLVEAHFI